jgi:hypothetical protein
MMRGGRALSTPDRHLTLQPLREAAMPNPSNTIRKRGRQPTHGMWGTPTYQSWRGMFDRCCNLKNKNYGLYGGRGIKVCDRWRSFQNFFEDMGEKPAGLSLDRRDNDGNYEPGNCRWATRSQQQSNQQRQRLTRSLASCGP